MSQYLPKCIQPNSNKEVLNIVIMYFPQKKKAQSTPGTSPGIPCLRLTSLPDARQDELPPKTADKLCINSKAAGSAFPPHLSPRFTPTSQDYFCQGDIISVRRQIISVKIISAPHS